jgi:hypothetical protein
MAKRPASRSKSPAPDPTPADPAEPKPKRVRSTPRDRSASTASDESTTGAHAAEPTADDIRRRAYERYQARGGNHGQHFDDWLEAEKELRSRK